MLKFRKWFFEWSDQNPINYRKPAILAATATLSVAAAALIVIYDNPNEIVNEQTGPRGIGMSVPKFVRENAQYDPAVETYVAFDRVEVPEGTPTAAEAYGEVIAFGDMDKANFDQLQAAMSAWTGSDIVLYDNGQVDAAQLEVTKSCVELTQYLNSDWDVHNLASDGRGVNCYTCHRGEPTPPETWYKSGNVSGIARGWGAVQNRVMIEGAYSQSEYTSLPVDAVEKYLLDGESIKVHSLESRVPTLEGDPTWQNAERTFSLMNHQSNALNVNCVYCHNSRAFYDPTQVTPQWSITTLAQQMAIDVNQTFFEPRAEYLPAEKLGPMGDAGKMNCATCHNGVVSPLNGTDMIGAWPELAEVQ